MKPRQKADRGQIERARAFGGARGPAGLEPRCPGELCTFWSGANRAYCTCQGTLDGGPNTRLSCVDAGQVP